ncbi:MAG: PorT family protein [Saprospiraceae bacterium]|nr:PorT family protein [Saprospiraceae bacterium]
MPIKKTIITFICISLFLIISDVILAQKFGGGITLGFNASQIDGDDMAGYHKIGWNSGLNTSYNLNDPWQINVDFLFSQRGSQSQLIPDDTESLRKITLNYIELPVYIAYQDWKIEDDFYKVQGFAGLSAGRLFSVKNALGDDDINGDNFLKNDLSYVLGAKFMFSKHLGMTGRYTRSFIKMYKNPEDGSRSLLSYFLNFSLFYKIL